MFKTNTLAKAIRSSILIGASAIAYNAYAAEEPKLNNNTTAEQSLEEEEVKEKVVVTGSRIRKAEFSEASPIQVIDGEIQREMGLFDAAQMLQNSNQASGIQIDNTFGGYVLDNGPGSATIGFRNLGADRTLVLINGRRMAPAGVGGAPTAPDLNLIPGVMVERVENLLDGASTVYGSDAIAGVANVILKKDVEGFDIEAAYSKPDGDGGEEATLSGMWGKTFDNGFVSVGVDYNKIESQSYGGNPFVKGCTERFFYTPDGKVINRNSGLGPTPNGDDSCDIFPLTNRIFVPGGIWGSLYYTPGYTNTGLSNFNFSETTQNFAWAGAFPTWKAADSDGDGKNDTTIVDGNGDGYIDVDLQNPLYAFQQSEYYKSGDYKSGQERVSAMLTGEYGFQDTSDTTVYYEALYAKRETALFDPGAQLFEYVSKNNPFNPCGIYGQKCNQIIGRTAAVDVQPIINIRGDRDRANVEVSQYRAVAGVTANLPVFENIGLSNWYYDIYVAHSGSKGTNDLEGISEDRLLNSLNTAVKNTNGSITCGNGTDGCVPVNLFADNIFQAGGGTLTQAERDYLFVNRSMETEVTQTIASGFLGGDLFNLPWNDEAVGSIFGAEWREDGIKSNPNDVAYQGLLWGYFSDKGADGTRRLNEAFTEFDFPLLKGVPGAEELTLIASGRISDETFYDAATTYSLKAVYRPVEWFTIRGTQGTSYRAPNLRERFLNGTTGFVTVGDPCVVPTDARKLDPSNPSAPPTYDPSLDKRDAGVLAACRNAGLDPTKLGIPTATDPGFTDSYSVEQVKGGSERLEEETSVAKTYGFIFEQPFSEDFTLTLSATRFDIEVTNSIAEPSTGYSISQCYSSAGNPAFCERLTRDDTTQKITLGDASFINVGLLTSKGWDYNVYFQKEFVVFENSLDVSVDLQATQMTESLFDVLGKLDDDLGEPSVPEWRGAAMLRVEYDDFRFGWQTRMIGSGIEDYNPTSGPKFVPNTAGCRGMTNSDGSPLLCRPVDYTEDYWVHNVSVGYAMDNYEISVGLRNVFNDAPPKVDPSGSFSNTNIPLGVGYQQPRTVYLNVGAKF